MQSSTSIHQLPQLAVRPEPGLARGLWEAPAWVFLAVLAAAVVAGVACVGAAFRHARAAR